MRWFVPFAVAALVAAPPAAGVSAQRRSSAPPVQGLKKIATDVTCASEIGAGVRTKRHFCDVIITANPAESVSMSIPPHLGAATLTFDLHNRFDLPTQALAPTVFARHVATVSVIRSTGEPIERGVAVAAEFRSPTTDTFDRIDAGDATGAVKAVAPGPPQTIRVTIPAGVTSIGIVAVKLSAMGPSGRTEVVQTAGRPIAIVSNLKIEYTPR